MEIEELEVLAGEMRSWAERLAENTPGKYPDRLQMKAFLTECGFDLEKVKKYEGSMKKWTAGGMSEAIIAILGEKKWEEIKAWNEEYIKDYEGRTGHTLPSIPVYGKGTKEVVGRSKQSSMKHFLGVIVRWGALNAEEDPNFTEDKLREETDVRIANGLLRLQGADREDLLPLTRPDTEEVYHPSLPLDYPIALIDKLLQK